MSETFSQQVHQQVERLKSKSLQEIERAVAHKRREWIKEHAPSSGHASPTPRQAFEMLFFDYMGLRPDDLPIQSETDSEIVWFSQNDCPTLEACRLLNLDTRQVCRSAYEKSTQAFVSCLDPQLRFLRSYQDIRPYANNCLERIIRVDFDTMMEIAIEEARLSRREGNKGYGAVAVLGNRVITQAHDTAATQKDPSLHAEVNVIRQAVQVLGDSNLSGVILFSTCEPCPMCASLAAWSNLTTIVYGASIEETAQLGKSRIMIRASEVAEKSPVMLEVIGGVLKEKCLLIYN